MNNRIEEPHDEDMRKLKVLSKNELIKKLNKYSYKKHNITT